MNKAGVRTTVVPVSGPPLDIVAIRDDDALIEALRVGLRPDDASTLAGMLATWRDDVQRSTQLRAAFPLGSG